VTYHDQPYYKEFRDLLSRIQSGVTELKKENERLSGENRDLSNELKEVRGELAQAQREVDRLNSEREVRANESGDSGKEINPMLKSEYKTSTGATLSLFDDLDDKEKRIIRQQIIEMISRIDKHLNRAELSGTSESS